MHCVLLVVFLDLEDTHLAILMNYYMEVAERQAGHHIVKEGLLWVIETLSGLVSRVGVWVSGVLPILHLILGKLHLPAVLHCPYL